MRLIADGVVDREGVPGLAARLGYSTRQIERQLLAELGAGPLALARAQRAQTARLLIETTALPMADVAFAAGFASVRTSTTPCARSSRSRPASCAPGSPRAARPPRPGTLALRLPFRAPLFPDNLFGHLAATAVPGVEEWRDGAYRRTLRLPHGHGIVALRPAARPHRAASCRLTDLRDLHAGDQPLPPAARPRRRPGRGRRRCCAADPVLAPLVPRPPAGGCRGPSTGTSSRSARCSASRSRRPRPAPTPAGWSRAYGEPVDDPGGRPHPPLPDPDGAGRARPGERSRCRRAAATTLAALVGALAERRARPRRRQRLAARPAPQLAALPGLRAVDGRDHRDARARRPGRLPPDRPRRPPRRRATRPAATPAALTGTPPRWRPWRAYAVQYLWATGDHPINRLPERVTAPRTDARRRRPPAHTVVDSPSARSPWSPTTDALAGLYMADAAAPARPQETFGEPDDDTVFAAASEQLAAYFAGDLHRVRPAAATSPAPRSSGGSGRRCATIPYGETVSLRRARRARSASRGASRAVGLANGKNPVGIIVPCHRVIGANGSLTGYGGGLERKRWLLSFESGAQQPTLM